MMYIASVFSQLERETIAERIRDNMHELSKTGRWLGGTTPTGYCSKSVRTVTVDGKARKACMLELIPEEGETVKLVYAMFAETHSLTESGACFGEGCTTKRGKNFTRFAIKGILKNPVYLIADEAAYGYFTENQVDLFAEKWEFDGEHGVLAYNRTHQSNGKHTYIFRSVNGSYPWGNTGGLSLQRFGWKHRPRWSTTDPRHTAGRAATRRC